MLRYRFSRSLAVLTFIFLLAGCGDEFLAPEGVAGGRVFFNQWDSVAAKNYVCSVELDGSGYRRLLAGSILVDAPVGERMVCIMGDGTADETVIVAATDGTVIRTRSPLLFSGSPVSGRSTLLSPDGGIIVRSGITENVVVMDLYQDATRGIKYAASYGMDFSPDGRMLATSTGHVLYLVTLEDSRGRVLASDSVRLMREPAWSPAGRSVLYIDATGSDRATQGLHIIDTTGTSSRLLVGGAGISAAAWSRDGQRVAFVRDGSLWVVDVDGRNLRRLTDGQWPTIGPGRLQWSANRRWIVFNGVEQGRSFVGVIDADGSTMRKVADSAYGGVMAR